MGKSFFEFSNKDFTTMKSDYRNNKDKLNEKDFDNEKFNNEKIDKRIQPEISQNLNIDMLEKYQNMSNDELMTNLLQEVSRQKSNGTFDILKLENAIDGLGSFLNDEQKSNIKGLLNRIK